MTWRATIQKDQPWDLAVRLYVYRVRADGRMDILLSDGVMQTLEEAVAPPENAGLPIPAEALEAIAEVFHPHATGLARLEGEIKMLRDSLALERSRVEALLNAARKKAFDE
jgi:hypothetical protein